jgi:hypothetical protein
LDDKGTLQMMETGLARIATGAVAGTPKLLLKLEGLALAVAAVWLYYRSGASWILFVVLLLAPDLSFLGYRAGPQVGAVAYNAVHTTLLPIMLGLAGLIVSSPLAQHLALIWLAHIGIDRALGYGLKYGEGFGLTHLGRVGKSANTGG